MTPLRFSRLKLMGRSPAHYAACVETDQTSEMETGSAADLMLLTDRRVLAYPGAVRRGKDYDAFCEANPDALILTQTDYAKANGIAEAVRSNADAMRLLTGERQQTLYWNFAGRDCRGTPDVRGDGFLTDLKTGETSDPRQFPWKVKRFAYHAQMAFYESGCGVLGIPITDSYIIAVEQAPPHVVTIFRLTPALIEMGDRLWRLWFEQLLVCESSGVFPPYAQDIVDLELPGDEDIDIADATELVSTTA